ncbi:MAG: nitroreductase family protein [Burkholderiaceae bacterium]
MPHAPSPADVLDHLALRYSVGPKYLTEPAPSRDELINAVRIALRAPDHGGLKPFRFVRIDARQRDRLGALFALGAERRGRSPQEIEQARSRAHNGPALLALVGRPQEGVADIPVLEQWLCVGSGLMNFLNALHLMGYGAKVLSGASVRDAEVESAFCGEGETLLAWIVVGTPTRSAHPKHEDDVNHTLSDWQG